MPSNGPVQSPEQHRRKEDALRPNPFLGYDRNRLAQHLMKRGAFAPAEAELRRAVWLNPYEPVFGANLAWCLYRQGRELEARDILEELLEKYPDCEDAREMAKRLEEGIP